MTRRMVPKLAAKRRAAKELAARRAKAKAALRYREIEDELFSRDAFLKPVSGEIVYEDGTPMSVKDQRAPVFSRLAWFFKPTRVSH